MHPIGGLGFVGFAEEVRQQEAGTRLPLRLHRHLFRHRQHAGGDGGGICGRRPGRPGDRHRRIGQAPTNLRPDPRGSRDKTAELVGLGREISRRRNRARPDYGVRHTACRSEGTMRGDPPCARTKAMITDPVYEGKSMQGMMDRAQGLNSRRLQDPVCASWRRAGNQRLQLLLQGRLSWFLSAAAAKVSRWDARESGRPHLRDRAL